MVIIQMGEIMKEYFYSGYFINKSSGQQLGTFYGTASCPDNMTANDLMKQVTESSVKDAIAAGHSGFNIHFNTFNKV